MNPIKNDSPDNGSAQPKNTLPFNLADALVGKTVIHEYKRSKAVQVVRVDKLPESCCVLVVFEDGEHGFYSTTGQSADGCVRLWMEHTGDPVPFTVEGWKRGWKPVYRDGTLPLEVHVFETATREAQPVISVAPDGKLLSQRIDGAYVTMGSSDHFWDLLLIPTATP